MYPPVILGANLWEIPHKQSKFYLYFNLLANFSSEPSTITTIHWKPAHERIQHQIGLFNANES